MGNTGVRNSFNLEFYRELLGAQVFRRNKAPPFFPSPMRAQAQQIRQACGNNNPTTRDPRSSGRESSHLSLSLLPTIAPTVALLAVSMCAIVTAAKG